MHSVSIVRRTWAQLSALRTPVSRGAVILMYHGVVERLQDPELDEYAVPLDVFREHLRFLARHRAVVPLARLVATLRDGDAPDPRWVALTFDDALRNQIRRAAPLLADHGFPWALAVPARLIGTGRSVWSYEFAVLRQIYPPARNDAGLRARLFAARPTERLRQLDELIAAAGRERFLDRLQAYGEFMLADWADLRAIAAQGVEMLSHGATHAPFSSAWSADDARAELETSRRLLEEKLGCTVRGYAAPHSVATPDLPAALAQAGYEFGLGSGAAPVERHTPLLALPRYDAAWSLPSLRRYCLG